MMTLKEKTTQTGALNLKVKNVVEKLYELRKAFEADYSGALRSRKYEATRDFTINLNHAIFEANQVISEASNENENIVQLENKLNSLRQNLNALLN